MSDPEDYLTAGFPGTTRTTADGAKIIVRLATLQDDGNPARPDDPTNRDYTPGTRRGAMKAATAVRT